VSSPSTPPTGGSTIGANEVAHVARLARLDLTADELTRTTAQLAGIVEHFHDIDALDLAAVEPMTQPFPLVNVLREDVVRPCVDRDEVLASAPSADDRRFAVPPILDNDDPEASVSR
jgi:aspartyl-tRNA(Asn)/glutamyl-tRNA(Gln) amidotransferase subunit C